MSTKGLKFSEETRKRMSESRKGNKHPMYGRKHSESSKAKMSVAKKGKLPKHLDGYWIGKKQTSEHREKSVKSLLINPHRYQKGQIAPMKGKKNMKIAGKNHYRWMGGTTPINKQIRNSLEYKLWRTAVFERDKYTCIWCGQIGGKLNADHIKPFSLYPELRLAIDNGRTLCVPCHKTTDTYAGRIRVINTN